MASNRTKPDGPPVPALTVLIFAAAVLPFLPALRAGFLWDDYALTDNALVASPGGLARIWLSPSENTYESHYWPLVYTTFWIEHKLWGFRPAGYHAVNILLHAANALLVFFILRRAGARTGFAAAVLFALHPVHAESVAWVIERKDVLSGFFYLAAALAFLRHIERGSNGAWWAAFFLFVLSMLGKSVAVTWPVAMLLWRAGAGGTLPVRAWIARLSPMMAAAVVFAWLDSRWAASRGPYETGFGLAERLCLSSRAAWFYLGKSVWPTGLAAVYPRWAADGPPALAWMFPAAGLALMCAMATRPVGRVIGLAAIFHLVTLAPTLGWVDFSFMRHSFAADRFQYLALIGPGLVLVWTRGWIEARVKHSRSFTPNPGRILGAITLAMLFLLTWKGALRHHDQETLFEETLRVNPTDAFRATAARAFHTMGLADAGAGRADDAHRRLRRASELQPDSPLYAASVGKFLLAARAPGEAEAAFERALKLKPEFSVALAGLASVRRAQGREAEAHVLDARAAAATPPFRLAPLRLGLTRLDPEDPAQVQAVAARAEDAPSDPGAIHDLAVVHFLKGNFDASGKVLERLTTLDAARPESWFLLGLVHLNAGRNDEAMAAFHKSFTLRPAMRELLEQLKTGDGY